MKGNDPMRLDYEIKAIFHDTESTCAKVYLQLAAFIKILHPTYSHYLVSLHYF